MRVDKYRSIIVGTNITYVIGQESHLYLKFPAVADESFLFLKPAVLLFIWELESKSYLDCVSSWHQTILTNLYLINFVREKLGAVLFVLFKEHCNLKRHDFSFPAEDFAPHKVFYRNREWGLYWGGSLSTGVCIGGLGVGQTPPSDTVGYGQQAGGMHPAGIHSC